MWAGRSAELQPAARIRLFFIFFATTFKKKKRRPWMWPYRFYTINYDLHIFYITVELIFFKEKLRFFFFRLISYLPIPIPCHWFLFISTQFDEQDLELAGCRSSIISSEPFYFLSYCQIVSLRGLNSQWFIISRQTPNQTMSSAFWPSAEEVRTLVFINGSLMAEWPLRLIVIQWESNKGS